MMMEINILIGLSATHRADTIDLTSDLNEGIGSDAEQQQSFYECQ